MRRTVLTIIILALGLLGSCSRPQSVEPFITREKSEYGDTYSFNLDMADTTVDYSLEFYTRVERKAFEAYPVDTLNLGVRWVSPSDSSFQDYLVLRLENPIDSAYASKDYRFAYMDPVPVREHGKWRIRIQVRNNPECVRGLGIIFTRKTTNGTRQTP